MGDDDDDDDDDFDDDDPKKRKEKRKKKKAKAGAGGDGGTKKKKQKRKAKKGKKRTFDPTVNIMDYKAPANAEFTDIQKWEDKVAEVWKEVRAITYGGPPLRKLIHERVRMLEAL